MKNLLRLVFFTLLVRPVVYTFLGLNIRRGKILPSQGPAIVVANHNSHLDVMVLISLLPLNQINNICAVASENYFFHSALLAWFARNILGLIPLRPGTGKPRTEVLEEVFDALAEKKIVIIFPEGTRGEPERFSPFRSGVATLATARPDVPVYPVYMHGLGKALPKGSQLFVPFNCDVFVAPPIGGFNRETEFMESLRHKMTNLLEEGQFPAYH
jgi:1-acyl-sn-glycerol-3-phosphate acyltransferase